MATPICGLVDQGSPFVLSDAYKNGVLLPGYGGRYRCKRDEIAPAGFSTLNGMLMVGVGENRFLTTVWYVPGADITSSTKQ